MHELLDYRNETRAHPLAPAPSVGELVLRARRARRRRRAAGGSVAAVVALLVVGGIFVAGSRSQPGGTVAAHGSTSIPPDPLGDHPAVDASGSFEATWLPEGYDSSSEPRETTLPTGAIARVQRFWPGEFSPSLISFLTVTTVRNTDAAADMASIASTTGAEPLEVRGNPGYLFSPEPADGTTALAWAESESTTVWLSARDLDAGDLLRVAEGLRSP